MDHFKSLMYNRQLLESTSYYAQAVWAIDLEDETITFLMDRVNPENEGQTWPIERFINLLKDLFDDDYLKAFLPTLSLEHLRELDSTEDTELMARVHGGQPRLVNHVKSPEKDENGVTKRVFGTFYDIQATAERDSMNEVLRSIGSGYFCIYEVDYDNCWMFERTAPALIRDHLGIQGNAIDFMRRLCDDFVSKESLDSVHKFIEWDTIPERLRNQNFVSVEYLIDDFGWCRGNFVVLSRKQNGEVKRFLYVARIIDAEKSNALNQMRIINSLSQDFLNVFIANIEQHTIRSYKVKTDVMKVLQQQEGVDYPFEEFAQHFAQVRVHPEDREAFLKTFNIDYLKRKFQEQDSYDFNYRVIADDGIHYYQGHLMMLGASELLMGFRNVDKVVETEQKRQAEMREMNEIVTALSQEFVNVFVIKPERKVMQGIKLEGYLVPGFSQLDVEYSYDGIMKKYLSSNRVHPEDQGMLYEACSLERVIEELKNANKYEGNFRAIEDGKTHYYQFSFTRLSEKRIILAFRCIDKIVEKEQKQLAAMEHIYNIVTGLTRDFANVYVVDIKNYTVESFKEDGLSVVSRIGTGGRRRKADYDQAWKYYTNSNVLEEDRDALYQVGRLPNVLKELETSDEFTYNYRIRRNNEIHYVQFVAIYLDNNTLIEGFRNIDSVMKQEVESRRLIEDALSVAEQANKAKTFFLNNMSHDIRTPMNAILGYSTLANAHANEPERVKNYLSKIQTASGHLLSLVNDVLDMSRIESGKTQIEEKVCLLDDLLRGVKNMMSVEADNKGVEFIVSTKDVINNKVLCDSLRLNQVLLNIVSNAVKYTPEGGKVEVSLTQLPKIQTLAQESAETLANYMIVVKDNGVGMSKEYQEHVFEPFSRERNTTMAGVSGTGLGMTITKTLTELMGGRISLESEQGVGTEITLRFNFKVIE